TGLAHERGMNNIRNAPLPAGSGGEAFRAAWREILLPALEAFRPELLLVSAGFDGHRLDPLADLVLEADAYLRLCADWASAAGRHSQGRIVSLLEAGYRLGALRSSVVAQLRGLGACALSRPARNPGPRN